MYSGDSTSRPPVSTALNRIVRIPSSSPANDSTPAIAEFSPRAPAHGRVNVYATPLLSSPQPPAMAPGAAHVCCTTPSTMARRSRIPVLSDAAARVTAAESAVCHEPLAAATVCWAVKLGSCWSSMVTVAP